MGNPTHASDEDYQLYARPKEGQSQNSVQIVDDGDDGGAPSPGGTPSTGGTDRGGRAAPGAADRGGRAAPGGHGRPGPQNDQARAAGYTRAVDADGRTGVDGTEGIRGAQGTPVPGGFAASDGPRRRRFNPFLWAAWVLVAVLLIAGFAWLTGALEPDRYASYLYETSSESDSPKGPIAMNLYSLGPIPLLLGVMGAFTLLAVQAAGYRWVQGR